MIPRPLAAGSFINFMEPKEPRTAKSALKTIKHIQKVFYVVGVVNIILAFAALTISSYVSGAIEIIFGLITFLMGWLLNTSYKKFIPAATVVFAVVLLILKIVSFIFTKSFSPGGLILPIAFFIIAKQAKEDLKILENAKISESMNNSN